MAPNAGPFQLRLTDKLWQRCLWFIRKISKEQRIVPSSYILQEDCVHVGKVPYYGGFSVVSNGERRGCTIAVKQLKMNQGHSNNVFKVPLINLANHKFWGLMQSCWSETTSTRPTARQLLEYLSLASPTWAPPAVYPVVVVDPPSTADSGQLTLKISLIRPTCEVQGLVTQQIFLLFPLLCRFSFCLSSLFCFPPTHPCK